MENPKKFSRFSNNQQKERLYQITDERVQEIVRMVNILVNATIIIACLFLIGWFVLT